AARGKTERNAAMYEQGGTAYVYLIYGVHYCLNVVTGPAGAAEAVLIRALRPTDGPEAMKRRRGKADARELCSGPGKLCEALDIDLEQNFADLTGSGLYICGDHDEAHAVPPERIRTTTRIGLPAGKGDELPLRYFPAGSEFVSRR
ncbi:MAG: DNA-3-methyladenine glycosylase, partial [Candidatus Hydrogenedentes bacterium]|nr:DNA-3-methyladenine glycosylase [Candidatus Hydrogenedentota bacterium]